MGMIKKEKKVKTYSEDHVAMMLEEIHGQFKALDDGLKNLNSKIDDLSDRMDKMDIRLSKVEDKVLWLSSKFLVMDGKIDGIKRDIKDSYKFTSDYFSRIEKEIVPMKAEIKELKSSVQGKVDLQRLLILEKKIVVIEKKLARA